MQKKVLISALVGTICLLGNSSSHAANSTAATPDNTNHVSIPIPQEFAKIPKDQMKLFAYPNLTDYKGTKKFILDDPDSPLGKAMTAPPEHAHDMTTPVKRMYPTRFGIYDSTTKKDFAFDVPKIPADEKYHWYKLGNFEVGPRTFVHGFFWKMKADIASAYVSAATLPDGNKWEVWVSVKYTGPAYVKDSTKPNQIFWDQVVLVRPGKVKL